MLPVEELKSKDYKEFLVHEHNGEWTLFIWDSLIDLQRRTNLKHNQAFPQWKGKITVKKWQ